MLFAKLAKTFSDSPELSSLLSYADVIKFFDIIRWKRDDIASIQPSFIPGPPEHLPVSYHNFLMACFSLADEATKLVWFMLRELAWEIDEDERPEEIEMRAKSLVGLFLRHGIQYEIGFYNLRPPTRVCTDARCSQQSSLVTGAFRERPLVEPLTYKAVYFTRDLGPLPIWCTSLYCRSCKTRYYANYYVHDQATTRSYYPGVPSIIHSSQHTFVAAEVCELFVNLMVVSWTSATNCARVYNLGLGNKVTFEDLPSLWPTKFTLDVEQVWEGFFLYSLLLEHKERDSILELRHDAPNQMERLRPALNARNIAMVGPGQPEWNHACDLCCWIHEDDDGVIRAVRSVVTDGVTVGHPCCAVHDCMEPLIMRKGARYCRIHSSKEAECAVKVCPNLAEEGFDTCSNPAHRSLELYKSQAGKAMFQLKRRLERLHISQTHDSVPSPPQLGDNFIGELNSVIDAEGPGIGEDNDVEVNEDGLCDGKPPTGNRKTRAQFGRKRTHNEELCVASCGVILGRATFFGSEAPNGVRDFLMNLFPTKASLPQVLWHDNNCQIRSMLKNDEEELQNYFEHCAMPVDVFHFKSKHKEADVDCGMYCNPYLWPELRTDDDKWRFDSSAAEHANAWFGGYQAMVREMQVDRYNFFLDEMIKRRNQMIVSELRRKGRRPYNIPREELLGAGLA